jgi:hypothetical protein
MGLLESRLGMVLLALVPVVGGCAFMAVLPHHDNAEQLRGRSRPSQSGSPSRGM